MGDELSVRELLLRAPAGVEAQIRSLALNPEERRAAIELHADEWMGVEKGARVIVSVDPVADLAVGPLLGEPPHLLRISDDDPLLWELGPRSQLFGTAPLPDPYRFFLEFTRLVRDELKIRRDPVRYLNWRGGLTEWLEIVYSRTFSLFTGPAPLAELAAELLERQAASYQLLPAGADHVSIDGSPDRLLFDVGCGWIMAGGAAVQIVPSGAT